MLMNGHQRFYQDTVNVRTMRESNLWNEGERCEPDRVYTWFIQEFSNP